jgi:hypothetical protein
VNKSEEMRTSKFDWKINSKMILRNQTAGGKEPHSDFWIQSSATYFPADTCHDVCDEEKKGNT